MDVSAVYEKNESMVKNPINSARLPQQNKFYSSDAVDNKIDFPKR